MPLPCGCRVEWDSEGTKLFLCGIHQFHYNIWDGTVEEFVNMVVTPEAGTMDRKQGFDSATLSGLK